MKGDAGRFSIKWMERLLCWPPPFFVALHIQSACRCAWFLWRREAGSAQSVQRELSQAAPGAMTRS